MLIKFLSLSLSLYSTCACLPPSRPPKAPARLSGLAFIAQIDLGKRSERSEEEKPDFHALSDKDEDEDDVDDDGGHVDDLLH